MLWLVQAHLDASWTPEADRPTPVLVHNRRDELDAFGLQLVDRALDVVAHQEELVVSDGPSPPGPRMDSELGRRQREDQPTLARIHEAKAEHVPEEGPRRLGVVDVEQRVDAGDHGLEMYPR